MGTRTGRGAEISSFLRSHPQLQLGGVKKFTVERRHHLEVLGIHAVAPAGVNPIGGGVEFAVVRGPHGSIPVRILCPSSAERERKRGEAGGVVYFHGGGDTVGSVDEFENGLRLVAEELVCLVCMLCPLIIGWSTISIATMMINQMRP